MTEYEVVVTKVRVRGDREVDWGRGGYLELVEVGKEGTFISSLPEASENEELVWGDVDDEDEVGEDEIVIGGERDMMEWKG